MKGAPDKPWERFDGITAIYTQGRNQVWRTDTLTTTSAQIRLTEQELETWDEFTKRIRRLCAQSASNKENASDSESQIKHLLIQRSRVLKQASGKVAIAAAILQSQYRSGDRWLVYCDDLSQLGNIQEALNQSGLSSMQYHSSMEGDKKNRPFAFSR